MSLYLSEVEVGKIRNDARQCLVNNRMENGVKGNAEVCTGKTSVATNKSRRYQWWSIIHRDRIESDINLRRKSIV